MTATATATLAADFFVAAMIVLSLSAGLAAAQSVTVPRPIDTPRSSTGETAKRSAHEAAIVDCERMWDRGTHMTKNEWAQTCRRVQNRLQLLEIR